MNRLQRIAVLAPLVFAAGCTDSEQQPQNNATTQADDAGSAYPSGSSGTLISPGGNELGTVQVSDGPDGVIVRIDARGLQPGTHGVQVHTAGRCQGPNFVSAGPRRTDGSDLPNLTIGSDGLLDQTVTVSGASLADLRDLDGSSLVIHTSPESPPTDQSGNAGDRIACAVI